MLIRRKSFQRIKSKIRQLSMWSEELKAVKNKGRFQRVVGHYKNGKPKKVWYNYCDSCSLGLPQDQIELDHVEEITQWVEAVDKEWVRVDWNGFMQAIWPQEEKLQRLCHHCHSQKTQSYVENLRLKQKGDGGLL